MTVNENAKKYLLIPHDAVMLNMSFSGLAANFEVTS